jgi:hypothetical protein
MRRTITLLTLAAGLWMLGGCESRSISDSGYRGDYSWRSGYRGELAETDLIAPEGGQATDAAIVSELADTRPVVPTRGAKLMLIQSGARQPDSAMLAALGSDFHVIPMSGTPPSAEKQQDIGRELRLMAAEGGVPQILCYWGELESGRSGEAGKVVSWLPIVGEIVPDETQHMRIVLRAVLIDVATGRWRMFTPPPYDDSRVSASANRAMSDQAQVGRLKEEGYRSLARSVVEAAG